MVVVLAESYIGFRAYRNYEGKAMAIYRMSFHVGNGGYDMFPLCKEQGVAAITYEPLAKTDLTNFSDTKRPTKWGELAANQKSSLGHVAFHMVGGDFIYVKDHQNIINRGIVVGVPEKRAYQFDKSFSIKDPNGTPWAHQVPVKWFSDIARTRLLLNAEMTTVLKLDDRRIRELNRTFGEIPVAPLNERQEEDLREAGYFRETSQSLKFISPLHNEMSNQFRRWIKKSLGIDAAREKNQIDIHFSYDNSSVIAELKICYGAKTRHAIRESVGQILEYNYYPGRSIFDQWLLILDKAPSSEDKRYIDKLRQHKGLPIYIGWSRGIDFHFHPKWP